MPRTFRTEKFIREVLFLMDIEHKNVNKFDDIFIRNTLISETEYLKYQDYMKAINKITKLITQPNINK